MGNPAAVRRDFESLEQRRREAAELLRQGMHPAEVARRVGVHRQSVGRWAQQLKQGGLRALKKADRAGRRPRLSPEELRRIERGLKRGHNCWVMKPHVDLSAGGSPDRTGMRGSISSRPCVAHPAATGMELSATYRARLGAR